MLSRCGSRSVLGCVGRRWGSTVPLVAAMEAHNPAKVACIDVDGKTATYGDILTRGRAIQAHLESTLGDVANQRVAVLTQPSSEFVATLVGVWEAGATVVPLCTTHPTVDHVYTVEDAGVAGVVCDAKFKPHCDAIRAEAGTAVVELGDVSDGGPAGRPAGGELPPATILYTSGTTGKPKGVITSHDALSSQVQGLLKEWEWQPTDSILHFLPLHHVHGLVNKLLCPLTIGARAEFMTFDACALWEAIVDKQDLTLLMGVPTVYARLIEAYGNMSPEDQAAAREGAARLRLTVSGSAALPVRVRKEWQDITGHVMLERYGMTEIGMALSQSYRGDRAAGTVGKPLPGVQVRLMTEDEEVASSGSPGELRIKGTSLFTAYWNREDATRDSFDADGWFETGDIAVCDADGTYSILGRKSTDIIKSSGHKISALDVETKLLELKDVAEVAVLGVPDDIRGEAVGAILRVKTQQGEAEVRQYINNRDVFGSDTKPRLLVFVDEIPKNHMGKVAKKSLLHLFDGVEPQ